MRRASLLAVTATVSAIVSGGAAGQGAKLKECAHCPAMMVIPAGHFTMKRKSASDGRRDDDPEGVPKSKPAREVDIESAFALGVYPVTRREFSVFVHETHRSADTGCDVQKEGVWIEDGTKSWRNPGFAQTERDPVTCVSWLDAQDYIRWLNGKHLQADGSGAKTGAYRLPSWEEAEYAAGGGTTTAFYWGERALRDQANYGADRCLPCGPARMGEDRWLYTSPVGSFPPNAFGLYDMAGNVWQWAQSCRDDADATPPKKCRSQVVHGGSWLVNPEYLRVGEYGYLDVRNRNNETGFRVARTLN